MIDDLLITRNSVKGVFEVVVVSGNLSQRSASVAAPLSFAHVSRGDKLAPSFELPFSVAVKLMDALWENGIKPSNIPSDDSYVEAVKAHLRDMRELTFILIESKKY